MIWLNEVVEDLGLENVGPCCACVLSRLWVLWRPMW